MSVKLIAENILDADDFYSATEQEGERWGQPDPANENAGSFRPVTSGTPADFSYSGTATSDGAAGGTTLIDSALSIYGDNFFIGATLEITTFEQDTDEYHETDVGAGRLAITDANTVTITDLDDDEEVWLQNGWVGHDFDGDFEFHLRVNCTANAASGDTCGVWAVTNTADTLTDIDVAEGDYLALYWKENGGSDYLILEECNAGTLTSDTSVALTVGITNYHLVVKRDESVGTYGTLYCYIYSDSSHTTLVDTLTVTLTEKEDFNYLFWMIAKESGSAGCAWSGTIKDLEIVKTETQTVTDFAQATGTLTSAAFSFKVNTGSEYTLTLPFDTRDFRFELIGSGDAADATFKWSHDDGTTYFGRDSLNQANWVGETTIVSGDAVGNATVRYCVICEADNGDWVFAYRSVADDGLYYKISSDKGLSWGSATLILANAYPSSMIKLSSGRILLALGSSLYIYYSDDNGVTWSSMPVSSTVFQDIIEADNGMICGVKYTAGFQIEFYTSNDGGATWSEAVTVAAAANDQKFPCIIQADNGDLICAYTSDEDAVGDVEIKCKVSSDMGASWGSVIAVIDFTNDLAHPRLVKDLNGDIYCVAVDNSADVTLVYSRSTDNGATWGAKTTLKTTAGDDLCIGDIRVLSGHKAICVYHNVTDQDYIYVLRGMWEAYSGNACVVAPEAQKQNLICGADLTWLGGAGIAGDDWSFEAEYDFTMTNLIEDSPSRPWRSEQDNIACTIVIDMGAAARHYADSVAFFGCNLRTLSFQMNEDNSWTSPSVDESVSFDLGTGTIELTEQEDETGASWGPTYHGISLAAGQAFIRVEGVDLSAFADADNEYCIVLTDSAGKAAKGYIDAADAAEALGASSVTNGGFGADTAGWTAENGAILASVAGGQDGNCLQITCDGSNNPRATQVQTVSPGKLYKLSLYVKAGTEATWRIVCWDDDNGIDALTGSQAEATGDWAQHIFYITAPAGCTSLDVWLQQMATAGAGTTILFDTISFQEVTDGGTDGVHIVSAYGGTTRNWTEIESGFDYNDSTYDFEVYRVPLNEIEAPTFLASYKDHELKGKFFRFTSGDQDGSTFDILDNVGDYIILDASSALSDVWDADTFAVFQDKVAVTFTGGPYRYARISITAQHTADDYYQIGSMVLGRAVTLTDAFDAKYGKAHTYNIELLRTPAGGLIPVEHAGTQRRFTLRWSYSDDGRREVLALLDYIQGKNIVLIPDSTDLTDVFLVKRTSHAEQEWWKGDVATLDVDFEEVL